MNHAKIRRLDCRPSALLRAAAFLLLAAPGVAPSFAGEQWSPERANEWYAQQPWLIGCNFSPSTAINQLEMWQGETFDEETIDRELGWAASLGMNTVRVFSA
jgi:hypothetical protein